MKVTTDFTEAVMTDKDLLSIDILAVQTFMRDFLCPWHWLLIDSMLFEIVYESLY